jgi:cytochrome c-type biogenesis protein CcmH
MWRLMGVILLTAVMGSVSAKEALPAAENPATEARMMALANVLRCLVCQNQTIADSHADLAVDLRRQISEMIAAGRTDDEIKAYMVERYGDFVLYQPPVKSSTLLLWLGPALLVLLGVGFLVKTRRRVAGTTELAPETIERARQSLLKDHPLE